MFGFETQNSVYGQITTMCPYDALCLPQFSRTLFFAWQCKRIPKNYSANYVHNALRMHRRSGRKPHAHWFWDGSHLHLRNSHSHLFDKHFKNTQMHNWTWIPNSEKSNRFLISFCHLKQQKIFPIPAEWMRCKG